MDDTSAKLIEKYEKKIRSFEAEISRLQGLIAGIRQEAANEERVPPDQQALVLVPAQNGHTVGATKMDRLRDFLRRNGPLTRDQIRKTGLFPDDIVRSYIQERHGFIREADGRWGVKSH